MSCGQPHEVDCEKVVTEAFLSLDGEMTGDSCDEIRRHLDECSPCLRAYGLEEEFKRLVARKCGGDVPPEHLRTQVVARLREVRLEIAQVEFRAE